MISFQEGVIVTDGLAGECLHLVLEGGDDWRTPLQQVFNKNLGNSWCFLVMELRSGIAHFHVLRPQTVPTKSQTECAVLWLTELKDSARTSPPPPPPPKPKIVKKVVKKSSTDKGVAGADGKTTTSKTTKTITGQRVVRKKVTASITATAAVTTNGDTKTGNDVPVPSKKAVLSKNQNSLTNGTAATTKTGGGGDACTNGDGSGDSGVSIVDSDPEKSPKSKKPNDFDEDDRISSLERADSATGEFITPRSTPDPLSKVLLDPKTRTNDDSSAAATTTITTNGTKTDVSDMSASLTLRINNGGGSVVGYKYESSKKMEKIEEEEEKQKSDEWGRQRNLVLTSGYSTVNGHDSSTRVRRATPTRSSSTFTNSSLANVSGSMQR